MKVKGCTDACCQSCNEEVQGTASDMVLDDIKAVLESSLPSYLKLTVISVLTEGLPS